MLRAKTIQTRIKTRQGILIRDRVFLRGVARKDFLDRLRFLDQIQNRVISKTENKDSDHCQVYFNESSMQRSRRDIIDEGAYLECYEQKRRSPRIGQTGT